MVISILSSCFGLNTNIFVLETTIQSVAILNFLIPEGKSIRWDFLRRFSGHILAWIRSIVYSTAPRLSSKIIHPFDNQERFQQSLKVENVIYILSAMYFSVPLLSDAATRRIFRHLPVKSF